MAILGTRELEDFKKKYPAARKAFARWESVVNSARWRNFADLKATFNTADYVSGDTVFDVGGNKYRIITVIQYEASIVIVKYALTHEEYDRGGWK